MVAVMIDQGAGQGLQERGAEVEAVRAASAIADIVKIDQPPGYERGGWDLDNTIAPSVGAFQRQGAGVVTRRFDSLR
jgi:hypothetical protein